MTNPFEEITARLDALAVDVRKLHFRFNEKPVDEIGGMDLAVKMTGLARGTLYKLTHKREIPHSKVGGRVYFKRSELEQWISAGRRATVAEIAEEQMAGHE